ncbi:MAG: IS110 family transposase [Hydrogenimonas sp.]|nr:IS110 family transposase [Hydrogenimonas sp.]
MFYVGIDIAKKEHVACVMREDNLLEIKPFVFSASQNGFKKLLVQLQSLSCGLDDIIIGMEATGLLFENLYRYLQKFSYRVVLLNPYQSAKFREMDTMKRVKSDVKRRAKMYHRRQPKMYHDDRERSCYNPVI